MHSRGIIGVFLIAKVTAICPGLILDYHAFYLPPLHCLADIWALVCTGMKGI